MCTTLHLGYTERASGGGAGDVPAVGGGVAARCYGASGNRPLAKKGGLASRLGDVPL